MTYTVICERNKPTISNHCIVLDIDETLVHTFDERYDKVNELYVYNDPDFIKMRNRIYTIDVEDPSTKKGEGKHELMWGVFRPYLLDFLKFCFSYFKIVAIWTAGKRRYADKIVQSIIKGGEEPHIVYSRDECMDESGSCKTKELSKIMKECPNKMFITNTFIVDDRVENFIENQDNGILIPTYFPSATKEDLIDDSDDALEKLKEWFMLPEVIASTDIRTLDKTSIFFNQH